MTFYDMTWLERLLFLKRIKGSSGHEETTTSNTFATDMVAPLRKLLLSFAPKQSGSGDPSPTNIRPISGWDGVSVTRCGFNIWDEEWENGNISDSTGRNSGTSSSYFRSTNYIPCLPNNQYYWYSSRMTGNFRQFYYDKDKNFLSVTGTAWNDIKTTPADAYYMRFRVSNSHQDGETICVNISDASKNGTYEPYAGQTYSVSWQTEAGTVYGGTLDMVSGVLTVTQKLVDLGSLAWSVRNEYFRTAVQSDAKKGANNVLPNAHCSALVVGTPNGFLNTNNSITVARDGRFTAYSTSWTGWTGGQVQEALDGVMFAYELATPITYQLTPQQINTLIGTNVITTDANVEEIIYLKKAE